MKLGDYARHISQEADVKGYAADKSRANDPLIMPFIDFDREKAELKALQESTLGLCWVNAKGKMIPYDAGEFARVQTEIERLQDKVDYNACVLSELEAKVIELGIEHFSLNMIRGEKSKIQERIEQIRAQPDKDLAHKWKAIVEIGGDRAMYETLPEVEAARQRAAELIEPLESEIKVLDGQIESLASILRKIKR